MLWVTSSTVNSRPFSGATLWVFTPLRRLNIHVWPLSGVSHFSARSGSRSIVYGFASGPNLGRASRLLTSDWVVKIVHEFVRARSMRGGSR